MDSHLSRRQFVKTALATTAATLAAPAIVTAAKTDSSIIVGSGDHQYEVLHHFPQLPDKYRWMTTHNVAFDSEGLLYVIHEGQYDLKDHPTIFVFDPDGKFVRAFGEQFNGGGHGLEIRNEDGQDFLVRLRVSTAALLRQAHTKGEQLWRKGAPMESGLLRRRRRQIPPRKDDNPWDRNRFIPTNIAFLPDGGFLRDRRLRRVLRPPLRCRRQLGQHLRLGRANSRSA